MWLVHHCLKTCTICIFWYLLWDNVGYDCTVSHYNFAWWYTSDKQWHTLMLTISVGFGYQILYLTRPATPIYNLKHFFTIDNYGALLSTMFGSKFLCTLSLPGFSDLGLL